MRAVCYLALYIDDNGNLLHRVDEMTSATGIPEGSPEVTKSKAAYSTVEERKTDVRTLTSNASSTPRGYV